ncbi:hypothetical protein D3C73_1247770 [compost metagenome]
MLRIITPVIFCVVVRPWSRTGFVQLIDGLKIKYRQQMDMRNAKLSQVVNPQRNPVRIAQPGFRKCLKFAFVLHP